MRKIIVGLALVLAVNAKSYENQFDEALDFLEKEFNRCMDVHGLTYEDLEQMTTADSGELVIDEQFLETLRKFSCVFSCTYDAHGWMKDGDVQLAKIHKTIEQEIKGDVGVNYHELVDICAKEVRHDRAENDTACDVAWKFTVCLLEDYYEDEDERMTKH